MGGNGMDWHAWLSAARLEPALVYEYALVFARNELEADDVAYFDHEFLHSMGVSVAKHRLEILKLARLGRGRGRGRFPASSSPASLSRLLPAVERVARYVVSLVHREESSALVLVPSQQQPDVPCSNSKRGGNKALKRTKSKPKGAAAASPKATRATVLAIGGRGAAMVHAIKDVEKGGGHGDDGEEMVRWDRLFHDLKPN